MNKHLVFVYGTLRRGGQHAMSIGFPNSKFISDARVSGSLYDLGAYPGLLSDESKSIVVGEAYEVDEEILNELDDFEASSNYSRKQVEISLGTDRRTGWTYEPTPESCSPGTLITSGDWIEYAKTKAQEYLFTIVEGIQAKEEKFGFGELTPREQIFFCVWSLEAEVNNGGFDQYFINSAGDYAAETVAALRTIGAQLTASIVERAMAVFGPDGPNSIRSTRQAQVDRLLGAQRETLSELDDAFFAYEDNLSELLARYMRRV